MDEGSYDHGNDKDEQHVRTQWIIEKVIPHRAVWEKWNQKVESPKGPPNQRDKAHHPEAKIGDQRNVV
jgi:hypothetical protein